MESQDIEVKQLAGLPRELMKLRAIFKCGALVPVHD